MQAAVLLMAAVLVFSSSCSTRRSASQEEIASRLPTIPITLPNGKVIRAELAADPADQQRGLMYRTELPADRGMLFVFPQSGYHPFWMYHTLIPLDVLWLDRTRTIVFLSPKTPPCESEKPEDCPNYGGNSPAQFVLELAAGAAEAHGLKVGDRLQF